MAHLLFGLRDPQLAGAFIIGFSTPFTNPIHNFCSTFTGSATTCLTHLDYLLIYLQAINKYFSLLLIFRKMYRAGYIKSVMVATDISGLYISVHTQNS